MRKGQHQQWPSVCTRPLCLGLANQDKKHLERSRMCAGHEQTFSHPIPSTIRCTCGSPRVVLAFGVTGSPGIIQRKPDALGLCKHSPLHLRGLAQWGLVSSGSWDRPWGLGEAAQSCASREAGISPRASARCVVGSSASHFSLCSLPPPCGIRAAAFAEKSKYTWADNRVARFLGWQRVHISMIDFVCHVISGECSCPYSSMSLQLQPPSGLTLLNLGLSPSCLPPALAKSCSPCQDPFPPA